MDKIHLKERGFHIDSAKITGDLASSDQVIRVGLNGLYLSDTPIVSDIHLQVGYERPLPHLPKVIRYEINNVDLAPNELIPFVGRVKHVVGEVDLDNYERINLNATANLDNFEVMSSAVYCEFVRGQL